MAINGLSFGQAFMAPGTGLPASFSVTGDTTITATVTNSAGQIVRSLGTFPVTRNGSSIPWDGRGAGGASLPDGRYTLTLLSTDPSSDTTSAQTTITLDGTPPTAVMTSPRTIRLQQSVSFSVADAESGVASISVLIDGHGGGYSVPPNGEFSYPGPWNVGGHTWQIQATDNVGNPRTVSGRFVAANPPAPIACNRQVADGAARQSTIPIQLRQRFHRSFTGQHFSAGQVLCRNLRGNHAAGMIALYECCTITAPTPLGVFEAVRGKWRLVYSLVGRLVYNIKIQGHDLIEKSPVYRRTDVLCCPSHYRFFRLHWNGRRFVTIKGRLIHG